jgi:phage terminase large subunit-like protein
VADLHLEKLRRLATAQRRLQALKLRDAFDPFSLDSRPTPDQEEVLRGQKTFRYQWVRGGNQTGKSQLGGRIASWFFLREHPHIDIEGLWPDEPLLLIVVARTSEQYQELWLKKIKPFLPAGSFKEQKTGGTLQSVSHLKNGSKIVFQSHHNPTEAKEKLQSFVAHFVWMDELSDNLGVYEELHRRVQAKRGYFLATFTPKLRAPAVRQYIEKPHPQKQVYQLRMLDNPLYRGREDEILADINNLPRELRNTILEGDWYADDDQVYSFDPTHHQAFPDGYSVLWRHMYAIDPAASGKAGLVVAAEHPRTGCWYVIKAKYLKGEAATDLLDKVAAEVRGLNITHRVADPHEAWYISEALKRRQYYLTVRKDRRKEELIKNVSEALKTGWLKLAPSGCVDLEDEFGAARWSDTTPGKIVNGTKYHLLDALQYFVDTRPKFVPTAETVDVLVALDLANTKRKKTEAARHAAKKRSITRLKPAFGGRR